MNAFSEYGVSKTPQRPLWKKDPGALEQKLAEKQRLAKRYRQWKRQQAKEVLHAEPRLAGFMRYLRKAENSNELIEAIRESWLPGATQEVRLFALRMVSARCDHINRQNGFEALDDPLFGPTAYFRARDILYPGGRE